MAMASTNGGKNTTKKLKPSELATAKNSKMAKQEIPFGGIGKAVAKGVVKLAEKAAEKETAIRIANTKPVVKATKVVAKQIAKRDIKNTKKAVNAVADAQAKTKSAQIAKNSVKVIASGRDRGSAAAEYNRGAAMVKKNIASGKFAKDSAALVKQSKPAKVVKINSASKKTGK